MATELIHQLIKHLPHFAEEQGDFYAVSREQLCIALCQQTDTEKAVAENTVAICECLLESLACLNTDYLARGEWCFVSFPVQLLALSMLEAMSDTDSRFFEARPNEKHFWNTHSIDNEQKEQQLSVLKAIETRRQAFHTTQQAKPIRTIYVAWSLIKIEGHILFYQREDTQKRHDKQSGDYGLVGGRLNQYDLKGIVEDMNQRLLLLQSSNIDAIRPALAHTLKRELLEEVGLEYGKHYDFKLWRELSPYQQVQGAAPNYALTEYFISIYNIDLTLEGFCALQQISSNERLAWFSLDEMVQGQTQDGKIAYIRALLDDFKHLQVSLKHALLDVEDSFQADYQVDKKNYGVILAKDPSSHCYQGVVGKEKSFDLSLSTEQNALLLGLAAHQREFRLSSLHPEIVVLHPYGWIEVKAQSTLSKELVALASQLKSEVLIVENNLDRYFRLSLAPDNLFFDYDFYHWSVDVNTKENNFSITRKAIQTPLGVIDPVLNYASITLTLASNLKKLVDQQLHVAIYDNYRKSDVVNVVKQVGMSRLLKEVDGELRVFSKFICILD